MSAPLAAPPAADAALIDETEAERLTALSGKTLHRLHQRGEPVGRVKVGRSTRYHAPTLRRWIDAQAGITATPTA